MSDFRLKFLLSFLFVYCLCNPLAAQYKISQIIDENKIRIQEPYIYDGFVLSQFTMNNKTKLMQAEFTAFKGQNYQLYFCTSNFDDSVAVAVFDTQKAANGKREELLHTFTKKGEPLLFELNKKGNYTIEYSIPTCENAEYGFTKNECVVVLISYKNK